MRALSLALASLLLLSPLVSQAQSANASATASLMSEIAALEAQIQTLIGAGTSSSATASSTPAASNNGSGQCPLLTRTLSIGSSGSDVTSLQNFLSGGGYLSVAATGYFGGMTQTAVSKWQTQNGVLSASATFAAGLGIVGPKTRSAIMNSCGGGSVAKKQCLPASPPAQECVAGWQPVLDANGCTSYYTCTVQLPTVSPGQSASASSSAAASSSCAVVSKPSCSGTVLPFIKDQNGCVLSYQCVF